MTSHSSSESGLHYFGLVSFHDAVGQYGGRLPMASRAICIIEVSSIVAVPSVISHSVMTYA